MIGAVGMNKKKGGAAEKQEITMNIRK